jgi:hypothetical protein
MQMNGMATIKVVNPCQTQHISPSSEYLVKKKWCSKDMLIYADKKIKNLIFKV